MKKTLIVDDTKNIRVLLSTCLEMEGYEVITASDGKKAMVLLESDSFDLVFLDIKLPEISGTEVLRKMRDMGINTPVIIITAFATVKNAVDCTKLGSVAYLQKPFTADKIKSVLCELTKNGVFEKNNCIDINRIKELLDKNQFNDAMILLKQAIAINPSIAELYFLFGKAYEGIGDTVNADKFFGAYRIFTGE